MAGLVLTPAAVSVLAMRPSGPFLRVNSMLFAFGQFFNRVNHPVASILFSRLGG